MINSFVGTYYNLIILIEPLFCISVDLICEMKILFTTEKFHFERHLELQAKVDFKAHFITTKLS